MNFTKKVLSLDDKTSIIYFHSVFVPFNTRLGDNVLLSGCLGSVSLLVRSGN